MNDYDIWFSMIKLPQKEKLQLIKEFKNSKDIWYYKKQQIFWNNNDSKDKFQWRQDEIDLIKKRIELNKICTVSINDELYPHMLKNYEDAPWMLFFKGDIKKLNQKKNISIVGSRKCTSYGIDAAKIISRELSLNDINIVSGMAKGIDTEAHLSCLEQNGYTCAILGSGVDIVYPKENRKLYKDLTDRGGIISEFVPGTEPLAHNFPIRNRIISALSDIIIVVEADARSGSLITANIALEQGKDVMALPGSIFSNMSRGTNKLIKDGAYPLTSIDDIAEILGKDFKKEKSLKTVTFQGITKKIYDLFSSNPMHVDDIIRISNIDIKQLYEVLFELQLKNEIICLPGNYYAKLHSKIE